MFCSDAPLLAVAEKRLVKVEEPRRRREEMEVVWLLRVSNGGRLEGIGVGSSKEMLVRLGFVIVGSNFR